VCALSLFEQDPLIIEVLGADERADVLDTEGRAQLESRHIAIEKQRSQVYIQSSNTLKYKWQWRSKAQSGMGAKGCFCSEGVQVAENIVMINEELFPM
jgi:hypothetical protein